MEKRSATRREVNKYGSKSIRVGSLPGWRFRESASRYVSRKAAPKHFDAVGFADVARCTCFGTPKVHSRFAVLLNARRVSTGSINHTWHVQLHIGFVRGSGVTKAGLSLCFHGCGSRGTIHVTSLLNAFKWFRIFLEIPTVMPKSGVSWLVPKKIAASNCRSLRAKRPQQSPE